jgi:hypothetical protein
MNKDQLREEIRICLKILVWECNRTETTEEMIRHEEMIEDKIMEHIDAYREQKEVQYAVCEYCKVSGTEAKYPIHDPDFQRPVWIMVGDCCFKQVQTILRKKDN